MSPKLLHVSSLLAIVMVSAASAKVSHASEQMMGTKDQRNYVVYSRNTLELLEDSYVPTQKSGTLDRVQLSLAKGEYEPIHLGVYALAKEIRDVEIKVESPFRCTVYVRPSKALPESDWPEGVNFISVESQLQRRSDIDVIPQGKSRDFWLVVYAPPDAQTGVQYGTVHITPKGQPTTEVRLEVNVRPFVLQRPMVAFGDYFDQTLLPTFAQSDDWLRANYKFMNELGYNSTTFRGTQQREEGSTWKDYFLSHAVPIAQEVGSVQPDIPSVFLGNFCTTGRESGTPSWMKRFAIIRSEAQAKGWPEIMLYGRDEPPYPEESQEIRWEMTPWRDLPMRMASAMTARVAFGLGELHDVWIMRGGHITDEMQAEAARLGAEVWTYECEFYSNQPLRHRYYAGLYTWASKSAGNYIWAFHWIAWFDPNASYPQPTVSSEARREGIDDYRYLQMLECDIAAKPDDPVSIDASKWLDQLRDRLATVSPIGENVTNGHPLSIADFDAIRNKAAEYITRLGVADEPTKRFGAAGGLKDEAGVYRNEPLDVCIAGLSSSEARLRRAAAWSLSERGEAAAPAAEALAQQLKDPEVRIPALRALEAMGPGGAEAAVDEMAALTEHPDGFIRMSAAYALRSAGPKAIKPLEKLLQDKYQPATAAAGLSLASFGPAARPLLPTLIKMLDTPKANAPETYGSSLNWDSRGPALKIIEAIGPAAAPAVPKMLECWHGNDSGFYYWTGPLAAIGPGASAAIPALEDFRAKHGDENTIGVKAEIAFTLYCIRGSAKDLQTLAQLVDKPGANRDLAVKYLERLGPKARPIIPEIRAQLQKPDINPDLQTRLSQIIKEAEAQ